MPRPCQAAGRCRSLQAAAAQHGPLCMPARQGSAPLPQPYAASQQQPQPPPPPFTRTAGAINVSAWLGIKVSFQGDLSNVDGTVIDYSNWSEKEPNTYDDSIKGACTRFGGHWAAAAWHWAHSTQPACERLGSCGRGPGAACARLATAGAIYKPAGASLSPPLPGSQQPARSKNHQSVCITACLPPSRLPQVTLTTASGATASATSRDTLCASAKLAVSSPDLP